MVDRRQTPVTKQLASVLSRIGLVRTQKNEVPSAENPELTNALPLKPGVGRQNIATHALQISTFSAH